MLVESKRLVAIHLLVDLLFDLLSLVDARFLGLFGLGSHDAHDLLIRLVCDPQLGAQHGLASGNDTPAADLLVLVAVCSKDVVPAVTGQLERQGGDAHGMRPQRLELRLLNGGEFGVDRIEALVAHVVGGGDVGGNHAVGTL